jgi:hypothetical protein
MPSAVPASKIWTLRLKSGKHTVILFADPSQSLRSLKQNLLDALRETAPSNKLDDVPIPTSIDEVELAKPVDQLDVRKGWNAIGGPKSSDTSEDELAEDDSEVKSKTKAKRKTRDVNLKSLGIKENHVLAFRFTGAEDDETFGDDDLGWKVDIPFYEDMYGMENAGDLGVVPEYRG